MESESYSVFQFRKKCWWGKSCKQRKPKTFPSASGVSKVREPEGVALVRKGKSTYITAKFAWVVFFGWLVGFGMHA